MICCNIFIETWKNYRTHKSVLPVTRPKFEPETSQMEVGRVTVVMFNVYRGGVLVLYMVAGLSCVVFVLYLVFVVDVLLMTLHCFR